MARLTWTDGGRVLIDCPLCGQAARVDRHGDRLRLRCYGGCADDAVLRAVDLDRLLAETGGGGPNRAKHGDGTRMLAAEAFVDIRAERPRWLWESRIPLGAVTLLVGREKLGKSTLTTEVAARLSRGELPGDLLGHQAGTLFVSYEDSAARTGKPRLMAAGADLGLVHRVFARRGDAVDLVSLPDDVDDLVDLAVDRQVRLIVVDPFSAALNGSVDSHRDHDMRRAVAPLVQAAEGADLAVVLVAHWNKSQGGDALSRVLGSRGLTAAVRSVLAFGLPPDAEEGSADRVLAHAASNLAQEAESLQCRIEGDHVDGDDGEPIPTSKLVIVGSSDTRADDLLVTRTEDDRTDGDLAAEWLEDELADGAWHESREIKAQAKVAGIPERTLQRASQRLGVHVERRGIGDGRKTVSHWRLDAAPGGAGATKGGAASNPQPNAEIGSPDVTSRQDTDTGATCPIVDPRSCIAPTRPTAAGWRCERCNSYLSPKVGTTRWRQPAEGQQ